MKSPPQGFLVLSPNVEKLKKMLDTSKANSGGSEISQKLTKNDRRTFFSNEIISFNYFSRPLNKQ